MSYYTSYRLEVISGGDNGVDYKAAIIEHIGSNPLDYISKWYDHEEDMRFFSQMHPDVLFRLSGEGDNSVDDIWQKYFKDGEMQLCKGVVVYPPFDENLLK